MSSGTNGVRAVLGAGDGDGVRRRRRWSSGEDGVWRRMSSPTARVPQRVPVADRAKEDGRAPAEAEAELLAPTNGDGARVSSRTPRSSKARRMKRNSGDDC